jgi:hypothetical protein
MIRPLDEPLILSPRRLLLLALARARPGRALEPAGFSQRPTEEKLDLAVQAAQVIIRPVLERL